MVHRSGGLPIALVLATCIIHHGGLALRHEISTVSHTSNLEDDVPWSLKSDHTNKLWQKHVQMGRRVVAQQRDERSTLSRRLDSNERRERSISNIRNRITDNEFQRRQVGNRNERRQLNYRSEFRATSTGTPNDQNIQTIGNRRSKAILNTERDSLQLSRSNREVRLSSELRNSRSNSDIRRESRNQFTRQLLDIQGNIRQASNEARNERRASLSRLEQRREIDIRQSNRNERSRRDMRRMSESYVDKKEVSNPELISNTAASLTDIQRISTPDVDRRRFDENRVNSRQRSDKRQLDSRREMNSMHDNRERQSSRSRIDNRMPDVRRDVRLNLARDNDRRSNSNQDKRQQPTSRVENRRNDLRIFSESRVDTMKSGDLQRETRQTRRVNEFSINNRKDLNSRVNSQVLDNRQKNNQNVQNNRNIRNKRIDSNSVQENRRESVRNNNNRKTDETQNDNRVVSSRASMRRADSRRSLDSRVDTTRSESIQHENRQTRRVGENELSNRREIKSRVDSMLVNNRQNNRNIQNNRMIKNNRKVLNPIEVNRQESVRSSATRKTDEAQNDIRRAAREVSRLLDNRLVSNSKKRDNRKEFESRRNSRIENRQEFRTQRDIRLIEKTSKDNRRHITFDENKENIDTRHNIVTRRISDPQQERRQDTSYQRQTRRVAEVYRVDSARNSNRRITDTRLEINSKSQEEQPFKSSTRIDSRNANLPRVENVRGSPANSRRINSRQTPDIEINSQRRTRQENTSDRYNRRNTRSNNRQGTELRLNAQRKSDSQILSRKALEAREDMRLINEIRHISKTIRIERRVSNSRRENIQQIDRIDTRRKESSNLDNRRVILQNRNIRKISDSRMENRQQIGKIDYRRTNNDNLSQKRIIDLTREARRFSNSNSRRENQHQLKNDNTQIQINAHKENIIKPNSIMYESLDFVMQEASFIIPTTMKTSNSYFSFIEDTVQKVFNWNDFLPISEPNSQPTKYQQNKSVGETILNGVWTSLAGLALYHAVQPGKNIITCY